MNYCEHAIQFDCAGERLVGIVAAPVALAESGWAPGSTGVIIIVGGPQYRVGSHRQFVLLCRALASAGIPAFRFDYRGMGDGSGGQRAFEQVNEDIECAISTMLHHVPGLQKVVLWGLCDGASAALLYCDGSNDSRIAGLCLLNPWVRSAASLAKTQVKHYYTERLRQREFWVKLLSGRVAVGALSGLWRNLKLAVVPVVASTTPGSDTGYQTRMAGAWRRFKGPLLLILSGRDLTAKEFLDYAGSDTAWAGALDMPNVVRQNLIDADHTFSDPVHRRNVERLCIEWLRGK